MPFDMRLLVLVSSRIGDTLLVTPSLRAIRSSFPASYIDVRAHPKRMELLRHNPNIDHLGAITPGRARFMGWFRRNIADTALVFNSDPELLDYAARAANRVVSFESLQTQPNPEHRFVKVPRPTSPIHAVKERLLLAEAIGAHAAGYGLDYVVTTAEREFADGWLRRRGRLTGGPVIGVQLQSFPTKAHRDWPVGNFVELLGRIRRRFTASQFVLLGDRYGHSRAEEVQKRLGGGCIVAAGELSLRESAAMISMLDLYVGVDTGPTHISGALGVPMVALYHCLYPGRNLAPIGHPKCRVIEHPDTYARCGEFSNMGDIGVDIVWEQLEQLLDEFA